MKNLKLKKKYINKYSIDKCSIWINWQRKSIKFIDEYLSNKKYKKYIIDDMLKKQK